MLQHIFSPFLGIFCIGFFLNFANGINSLQTQERQQNSDQNRTFKIDYKKNQFLKDGRPFRYISGEIHYFRIHPSLWEERLQQIRSAGLNAIQFYIPWNFHESTPGSFNFAGDRDLFRFLGLAQQNQLDVLLRIGPYICSEWEFGGLPWWLIKNGNEGQIRLRTSDERYLESVRRYFSVLFLLLKPWLHKNGGPILMVQIENEYGNVPSLCDHSYMKWLRDLVWAQLGEEVVLYTTDNLHNEQQAICGTVEGVFPTIDFGVSQTAEMVKANFERQKRHSAAGRGPSVNSEFWTMWLSMWGENGVLRQQIGPILETMDAMWAQNASFSFYLFHGGTNFGFWSGQGLYFEIPGMVTTSYDFGAAINEAGQTTPLYGAIRNWIGNLGQNWPNPPLAIPANNRSGIALEQIDAIRFPNFIETLNASTTSTQFDRCLLSARIPLNFEQFNRNYQFVWYSTELDMGGSRLAIPRLHDRAYVFLDGKFQGKFLGSNREMDIIGRMGQRLDILVESIGRRTYPLTNVDSKGILSAVLFEGKPVGQRWLQCGVDMEAFYAKVVGQVNAKMPSNLQNGENLEGPAIYVAKLQMPPSGQDWPSNQMPHTFFDSRGWGRGVAMINGFNIGRYWPLAEPQTSLYVPGALFNQKEGKMNYFVLIELEGIQQNENKIRFLAEPIVKYTDKPFPPISSNRS